MVSNGSAKGATDEDYSPRRGKERIYNGCNNDCRTAAIIHNQLLGCLEKCGKNTSMDPLIPVGN